MLTMELISRFSYLLTPINDLKEKVMERGLLHAISHVDAPRLEV